MLRTPTIGPLSVAAVALLAAALSLPAAAQARGHRGGAHVAVGFGYGWGPYWGWGAPYWAGGWGPGPYSYGPRNGLLGYAMISGMGGLDVDAKPNRAAVWVDGRYVADARELDGDPSYLWLKQGVHHVVLYKVGFKSFEDDVDVRAGVLRRLKVQLEKGESQPPAAPPADVREPARREGGATRLEAGSLPEAAGPGGDVPGGEVRLRVQPRDATVYVDSQYRGSARELPGLRLGAGHHRIELVRPGYRPLQKEFDVEPDKAIELELNLERGGGWKY